MACVDAVLCIDAITDALWLSVLPAGAMVLLGFLSFMITVPSKVVSALQHLAAGIVLAAVSVELLPILSNAPNDTLTIASITAGFTAGIVLFLGISKFCSSDVGAAEDEPRVLDEPFLKHHERHHGTGVFDIGRITLMRMMGSNSNPPFPIPLFTAVGIDAFVDGFLIGLSSASGKSAGLVMAIALSIEMAFLGLTFAATIAKQSGPRRTLAVLSLGVVLLLGSVVGATTASAVAASVPLHAGVVAFGVAALLYLVTEERHAPPPRHLLCFHLPLELLLEAHSSQAEDHVWWIDLCFFVGFLTSFILEKYMR